MRKITDIYKEYNIMPILAMHQLRVASVASMICDSLNIKIDKDNIIKACLLHDMGNIIKFTLDYFPNATSPEGIEYWNDIKYNFILKYGNDEHVASLDIAKEIGVSDEVLRLIDCVEPHSIEVVSMSDKIGDKICVYADNRVTPHGIVSAEERSLEAKERYKGHSHAFDEEKRAFFMENLFSIEKQIFSQTKIKPEDINDESIKKYIESLKDFII